MSKDSPHLLLINPWIDDFAAYDFWAKPIGLLTATLCHEHAVRYSGADHVVSGPGEEASLNLLNRLTGYSPTQGFSFDNLDTLPYPAFDLQRHVNYAPILTSRGCPFRCAYCASGYLNPKMTRREPEGVIEEIGAYLLFGLPGQNLSDLEVSIETVKRSGIRPILAEYSPIPHTPLWEEAVKASRYDLESDPIFHNNSLFPCREEGFSWETTGRFKQLAWS